MGLNAQTILNAPMATTAPRIIALVLSARLRTSALRANGVREMVIINVLLASGVRVMVGTRNVHSVNSVQVEIFVPMMMCVPTVLDVQQERTVQRDKAAPQVGGAQNHEDVPEGLIPAQVWAARLVNDVLMDRSVLLGITVRCKRVVYEGNVQRVWHVVRDTIVPLLRTVARVVYLYAVSMLTWAAIDMW